jgi:hypothetical protein
MCSKKKNQLGPEFSSDEKDQKCIRENLSDAKIAEAFNENADTEKNMYPKLIEHISLHRKKSKKARESENRTNESDIQHLLSVLRTDYPPPEANGHDTQYNPAIPDLL